MTGWGHWGWLWHYEIGFQHHLPHDDDTAFLTVQCYLMGMLVWIVSVFTTAANLACSMALKLLRQDWAAVVSQLLMELARVLVEMHTVESNEWIDRLVELHQEYGAAVDQTAMPGPSMMLTTITLTTATQQPKGDGGSDGGVVWGLGGTHATAAATLSS